MDQCDAVLAFGLFQGKLELSFVVTVHRTYVFKAEALEQVIFQYALFEKVLKGGDSFDQRFSDERNPSKEVLHAGF